MSGSIYIELTLGKPICRFSSFFLQLASTSITRVTEISVVDEKEKQIFFLLRMGGIRKENSPEGDFPHSINNLFG